MSPPRWFVSVPSHRSEDSEPHMRFFMVWPWRPFPPASSCLFTALPSAWVILCLPNYCCLCISRSPRILAKIPLLVKTAHHIWPQFRSIVFFVTIEFDFFPFCRLILVCKYTFFIESFGAFPGSSAGIESACNAGGPSLIPGSGRSTGEGIGYPSQYSWASLVAQLVNNPPAMWEICVRSLGWKQLPTPVFWPG